MVSLFSRRAIEQPTPLKKMKFYISGMPNEHHASTNLTFLSSIVEIKKGAMTYRPHGAVPTNTVNARALQLADCRELRKLTN